MQHNDFEDEVGRMMEGFSVEPSEAVWQEVKPRIAGGKRRRRLVPVLLLAAALLGSSVYFLYDSSNNQKNISLKTEENKKTAIAPVADEKTGGNGQGKASEIENKNSSLSETVLPAGKNNAVADKVSGKLPVQDNAASILQIKKAETGMTVSKKAGKRTATLVKNAPVDSDNSFAAIKTDDDKVSAAKNTEGKDDNKYSHDILFKPQQPADDKASHATNNRIADTDKPVNGIESNVKEEAITKLKEKETASLKTETSKTKASPSKGKWAFAVDLKTGFSATGAGYLQKGFSEKNLQDIADVTTGAYGQAVQYPSAIKPGLSFEIGFAAVRKLSPRTSLSAGIGYRYASTSMSVGQWVSFSGGSAAGPGRSSDSLLLGSSATYRNSFHVIVLPFEIQSGIGRKLPLFWNAGVAVSKLISTNALQYNPVSGRYYADNGLFNNIQLGLSAGLSFNVASKNKAPFMIGPSVQYNLSNIAGKGVYNGSHYSFLGIRLQKQLGRK